MLGRKEAVVAWTLHWHRSGGKSPHIPFDPQHQQLWPGYYHGFTWTISATWSSFWTHDLLGSPLATSPVEQTLATRIPVLPQIFTTYSSYIDDTDTSYLHRKGALCILCESLQLILLRAYIEFVHPSMPILDLKYFLLMIKYGDQAHGARSKQKLSLLLFQAVMFAGAEFAGLRALLSGGFDSREAARNMLFDRTKLLYDFNATTDRHAVIQSLLHLSRYHNSPSLLQCHKDAHHYLGMAISLSFSMGFNRQPPSLPQVQVSRSKRRRERKIWWSTFIRDRVLAVESQRQAPGAWSTGRIRREECDVGMLCLADFDLPPEEVDDGIEEARAKENAAAVIEKAKLFWAQITYCSG